MNNLEERKRIAVSKADGYIGVFATGDCVESKFFQVVNANPKVKWIFHMFCHLYFESSHSGTPYMQLGFECVDSGNSKIPFNIGV